MAVDWSSIEQARSGAQQSVQTANEYAVKGNTLADELRLALGERYGQSDIAKQSATNRSQYLAAAPQARQDVLGLVNSGNILSPTQQNAILSAKRASALAPLMGGNIIEQAAFGTMEDLINAGTNAWNAKTQAAQGAAGLAQENYSTLLNQLLQQAQQERYDADAAREAELFPLQKEKLLAEIAATGRSNNGTSSTGDMATIDAWARNILDGVADITNVPDKLIGAVYTRVEELRKNDIREAEAANQKLLKEEELKKQNSIWNKGINWLGGQFKNAWDYLGRPDTQPIGATKL